MSVRSTPPDPRVSHAADLVQWLRKQINVEPPPLTDKVLTTILRAMAVWRASVIAFGVIRHFGPVVQSGPFTGMEYVRAATEGALLPRLLGSYESELHPTLLRFAEEGFDAVIDIGCAEGYYAVGMARLMPKATIHAYDIAEHAQAACRELAAINGVSDRVIVSGEFAPTAFEHFKGRKCLAIVDCEGAEVDLLRPDLSPALASVTLIVETHNVYRKDARHIIEDRFAPTHDIVRLDMGPKTLVLPPELAALSHLDQLLCVWEWRLRPTPWLVMTPKAG